MRWPTTASGGSPGSDGQAPSNPPPVTTSSATQSQARSPSCSSTEGSRSDRPSPHPKTSVPSRVRASWGAPGTGGRSASTSGATSMSTTGQSPASGDRRVPDTPGPSRRRSKNHPGADVRSHCPTRSHPAAASDPSESARRSGSAVPAARRRSGQRMTTSVGASSRGGGSRHTACVVTPANRVVRSVPTAATSPGGRAAAPRRRRRPRPRRVARGGGRRASPPARAPLGRRELGAARRSDRRGAPGDGATAPEPRSGRFADVVASHPATSAPPPPSCSAAAMVPSASPSDPAGLASSRPSRASRTADVHGTRPVHTSSRWSAIAPKTPMAS